MEEVYSGWPDLENPDWELYTDGSSFVYNTKHSVMTLSQVIESKAPARCFSAEAWTGCSNAGIGTEWKKVKIWTDSFDVVHALETE